MVYDSWIQVKANKGSAGVDNESIENFEKGYKNNLYKLWNRMSSGCYFPKAVKLVEIPKKNGGKRPLGIPTVTDRIAQMVCKAYLEPKLEKYFHKDSYGYRPYKSALEAIGKVRERSWQYNWIIDLDIKGFFDNIDHKLMMKAIRHHTDRKWIILYIERWLKCPVERKDGTIVERDKGTPQGGVISPLLANLFLHYAFDKWMDRNYPNVEFIRYADDCIIHCRSEKQAIFIRNMIEERLNECKLEMNIEKTKIVYCKDVSRPRTYENTEFDFLGYTFKGRGRRTKDGRIVLSFLPAVSYKTKKRLKLIIKGWKIPRWVDVKIEVISEYINQIIRGWIIYYGKYYKSEMNKVFKILNRQIVKWAKNKYKKLKNKWNKARNWYESLLRYNPLLFVHWKYGFITYFYKG